MTAAVSSGAGFDPRKEPAVSTGPQPHPEPSPEGLHQRTDNPGPSNPTIIERAAEVILHGRTLFATTADEIAQALDAAGLLVSNTQNAVIDAAVALDRWVGAAGMDDDDPTLRTALAELCSAVDAYLAARGEDQ